jgi:anti-sigma-K factor RskA
VPVTAVDGRGRFPELWIIPAGGKPRPVGMISGVRSLTLAGGEAKATFAVSLEPAGGSPTGAPTGPVIATGVLSAV